MQPFPLKQLGLKHIMDLPKYMPDVIKMERNAQGDPVFYALANSKVAHIVKLKMSEKGKKSRRGGAKKFLFEDSQAAVSQYWFPKQVGGPKSEYKLCSQTFNMMSLPMLLFFSPLRVPVIGVW